MIAYDDTVINVLNKLVRQRNPDVTYWYSPYMNGVNVCFICMTEFYSWNEIIEHGIIHYLKSRKLIAFL